MSSRTNYAKANDLVFDVNGILIDSADELNRELLGDMSSRTFKNWRGRQDYTLDSVAKALGLSRRIVAYYDQGVKPIPRVVALAAKALEAGL